MKRSFLSLIVMLILVFGIIGCTQNAQKPIDTTNSNPDNSANGKTPINPNPTETPKEPGIPSSTTPQSKTTLSELYDYGKLKEYSYRVITKVDGVEEFLDFTYTVSQSTLDGKDVWMQTGSAAKAPGQLLTKMWIDKITNKCLKFESSITDGTNTAVQPSSCPQSGPYDSTPDSSYAVSYQGTDTITVPYGTYEADRYSLGDMNIWYNDKIPIPIRIIYANGNSYIILKSYS